MNEMNRLYHLISCHYTRPNEAQHLSQARSILIESILDRHLENIEIQKLDDKALDVLHDLLEAFAKLLKYDFVKRASQYRYIYNRMIEFYQVRPIMDSKRTIQFY